MRTKSFKVVLLSGLVIASLVIALGPESVVSPPSPYVGLIKVWNGPQTEWFRGICPKFVVGYTDSFLGVNEEATIVRYSEYLTIPPTIGFDYRSRLSGLQNERFNAVTWDPLSTDVYAVGYTNTVGAGGYDALIARFDPYLTCPSRIVRTYAAGVSSADDVFWDVTGGLNDTTYVYAVGSTTYYGTRDALLVKFRKADLVPVEGYVFTGAEDDQFISVTDDATDVYIVGTTNTPPTNGDYDAWIVKFNKGPLMTYAGEWVHGGTVFDVFYGVTELGPYVYAVGSTSFPTRGYDALIVQYQKNPFIPLAGKTYGGTSDELFTAATNDGSNIFAVGHTIDPLLVSGMADALIVRFNQALVIDGQIILGGEKPDEFWDVCYDANELWAAGFTDSKPPYDRDALIFTVDPNLPNGTSADNCLIYKKITLPENFPLNDNWHFENYENMWVVSTGLTCEDIYLPEENCHVDPIYTGTATFKLENLYKVSLKKDLQLNTGSKLVVKFYKYDNVTLDNQSVIDNFVPPITILENENVPHPSGLPVEIVRLVLTTDDTADEISTIASFTATRSVLASRYLKIKSRYPIVPPEDRPALANEYMKIKTQYIKAPS